METWYPKSWAIPLIVAILIVPAFAGFALGGPALGIGVGGLSAVLLIGIAVRARHRGPIAVDEGEGAVPLTVVALAAIESPADAAHVRELAPPAAGDEDRPEVFVLAPARGRALDRWLSDLDPARYDAQRILTLSIATLTAAGIHAEGRVGDEDPVRATEDLLYQQGSAELAFVVDSHRYDREIDEVRDRLDRPVHRVEVTAPDGGPSTAG